MTKNLEIGSKIAVSVAQTNNATIEKYCYSDSDANCTNYGGLYQYNEAVQYKSPDAVETDIVQGICPAGWHIPRDTDFGTLATTLGGLSAAGTKMKEIGTTYWNADYGTNSSGFSARGAGYRTTGGSSSNLKDFGYFWTTLPVDASNAYNYYIKYSSGAALTRTSTARTTGYTVRCIKD
jgi:uncharacterized protein (TIGR02145 family)